MQAKLSSLPSLDALRGFVAAARRKSITLAAQDLCLTQSAVSRQIRSLEERLSQQLFVRRHRAIVLTEVGEQLFQFASPWMDQFAEFAENARRGRANPVTISASHGVCSLWLLPRLGAFKARYPAIDVRLTADNRVVDLEREGVDFALRYCADSVAPRSAIPLFKEVIVPVAAPALATGGYRGIAHWDDHVLLELDDRGRPWLRWNEWLRIRGHALRRTRGCLHFNQYDQVVQAALAGHGVALGRLGLLHPMLEDGRLVADASERLDIDDYGYWLVEAPGGQRQEVRQFRDWLLEQADETNTATRRGPIRDGICSSRITLEET
ncbi:MAG TPA: LysR substrate-binding domain-containing protein [Noviherbaspirillum sp.]|jgi:DNA-binding transcriptional LysR family regulator|uniref:LysR substrate-binding domain-containing protein n=1 Tax=Noviherbaspirillum sp. TaxID=1926288 RepID=UPI002F92CB3B